ncbi:MAG TPA: hypothetical protein VMJ93_12620 [Verrucomicrobiae bacterium]|nr:hypothetical protein [Verrucomicrobiae bacterium]
MASMEGIRSPFPWQPPARSPKLRIYESLFLLNQGVDYIVATLRGMEKLPFAHKDNLQCAQARIEEVRADVNADFVEELGDRERHDEGRFWKQRRAYEEKWRDPDDVYLSVEEREQERKQKGLPPRVGIIPHSAVAAEEERWEAEQERKKRRAGKRQKPTSQAREKGHD